MPDQDLKKMYSTKNLGDFPQTTQILGQNYTKVEDLRYGTNPHQPAAFYRPDNTDCVLGAYQTLKTGKGGLSQTNIEDMHHAIGILKFMNRPACAVMKHCNPSGVAIQTNDIPLIQIYKLARDADAQAAFGSIVLFNTQVDADTANEIMQTIVEGVAAPDFTDQALKILHDSDQYKRNKAIRIIKIPDITKLPKYIDDPTTTREIKVFDDGSIIIALPYLSRIKSADDLTLATNDHKKHGHIQINRKPTPQELDDLLFAWYTNIHVRSNGIIIAKNGQTLAVGTGQQDRIGAVQQAITKAQQKYTGTQTLQGAVMASDGFFPFPDAIQAATDHGITAIIQPGGSINDYTAIQQCNKTNTTMLFTQERCFSHH